MMYSLYSWMHANPYLVNAVFACILIITLWSFVSEKSKNKLCEKLRRGLHQKQGKNILTDKCKIRIPPQSVMLMSICIVNFFSIIVHDDYYLSTQYLSFAVSIVQGIALIRIFISKPPKQINSNSKSLLICGMFSIILAFTHVYYFLFVNTRIGFSNFDYIGMGGNFFLDWLNCLFYSISLIIPYSLTELIPNTYLIKTISLLQIVLFYVFIFKKLSSIFSSIDIKH